MLARVRDRRRELSRWRRCFVAYYSKRRRNAAFTTQLRTMSGASFLFPMHLSLSLSLCRNKQRNARVSKKSEIERRKDKDYSLSFLVTFVCSVVDCSRPNVNQESMVEGKMIDPLSTHVHIGDDNVRLPLHGWNNKSSHT